MHTDWLWHIADLSMVLKGERGGGGGGGGGGESFLVCFRSGAAPSSLQRQTGLTRISRLSISSVREKKRRKKKLKKKKKAEEETRPAAAARTQPVTSSRSAPSENAHGATYHVDFRHHVNAGDVYAHAHIDGGAYGKYDSGVLVSITAARWASHVGYMNRVDSGGCYLQSQAADGCHSPSAACPRWLSHMTCC